VTGQLEHDPSSNLKGALTPVKCTHFATLSDPIKVGALLRAIEDYTGNIHTRCALKLAALSFVRPGELRHAEWSEINLSAAEWIIPAAKMKMRHDHIVPLSRQALALLQKLATHKRISSYIFPCLRSQQRPMSENTINAALRRMGYSKAEMTGHGFRAMASTLLNEQGINADWIEIQLAHSDSNKVRAAYNRARYLPQRRIMMQQWADYLDCLKQQPKQTQGKETLCTFK
jgi:integrase